MNLSTILALECSALLAGTVVFLGCKTESAEADQEAAPPAVAEAAVLAETNSPTAVTGDAVEKPAPTDIKVSLNVSEVIKLAQSGVGDEVIIAYIANAPSLFNLTADEVLYLSDLGISDAVVAAMIKHRGATAEAVQQPRPVATNGIVAAPMQKELTPPSAPVTNPLPEAPSVVITATPEFEAGAQPPVLTYTAPAVQVQYNDFYSSLAPYGSWIQVPDYGLCWQPAAVVVNPSWRPYSDRGRWIFSDCGWYWQSDYSWGWAPFHYGRWQNHSRLGWVWLPDTTWGPAWVTWRYSDAYCGWAPLPPRTHFVEGVGLRYGNTHVGISFDFGLTQDCYTFVPTDRFHDRTPWRHALPVAHVGRIYHNTTIINDYSQTVNNVVINRGVDHDRIASLTRSEIRKVAIRDLPDDRGRSRPDRLEKVGSDMVVYRPQPPKGSGVGSNSRAQQEIRRPTFSNVQTGTRDNSGAAPDRDRSITIRPRPASQTDATPSSAKTIVPPGRSPGVRTSPPSVTSIESKPPPAVSTPSGNAATSQALRPGANIPARGSTEGRTIRPNRPTFANRPANETISTPSPSLSEPASRTDSSGTVQQPVRPVSEYRPAPAVETPLTRNPVRPVQGRELPRPVTASPDAALRESRGVVSSPSQTTERATLPPRSYGQPSPGFSAQSAGPSSTTRPSRFQESSATQPQPYSTPTPGSTYRQELQKPASYVNPERPSLSQPGQSYQPSSSYPGADSRSSSLPNYQNQPANIPSTRSAPPQNPSITTTPGPRNMPAPTFVQPQQVSPSPRSAPPSANTVPSRPASSGRRDDGNRQ
jgi:hypothetical protein